MNYPKKLSDATLPLRNYASTIPAMKADHLTPALEYMSCRGLAYFQNRFFEILEEHNIRNQPEKSLEIWKAFLSDEQLHRTFANSIELKSIFKMKYTSKNQLTIKLWYALVWHLHEDQTDLLEFAVDVPVIHKLRQYLTTNNDKVTTPKDRLNRLKAKAHNQVFLALGYNVKLSESFREQEDKMHFHLKFKNSVNIWCTFRPIISNRLKTAREISYKNLADMPYSEILRVANATVV